MYNIITEPGRTFMIFFSYVNKKGIAITIQNVEWREEKLLSAVNSKNLRRWTKQSYYQAWQNKQISSQQLACFFHYRHLFFSPSPLVTVIVVRPLPICLKMYRVIERIVDKRQESATPSIQNRWTTIKSARIPIYFCRVVKERMDGKLYFWREHRIRDPGDPGSIRRFFTTRSLGYTANSCAFLWPVLVESTDASNTTR